MSVPASDKIRRARFPGGGAEKVVVPDFDVCGGGGRGSSAENNHFTGSLQKIVYELERADGIGSEPAGNGLGIHARSGLGYAVEIGEKRIDHGDVTGVAKHNAARGLVLRRAVNPYAIEDQ